MSFQMIPNIFLCYTLRLKNNKYYVGISTNLNYRLAQHFSGKGSKWTKLHPPVDLVDVRIIPGDVSVTVWENQITMQLMRKYGYKNVRGGSYCSLVMKSPPHSLSTPHVVLANPVLPGRNIPLHQSNPSAFTGVKKKERACG